MRRVAPDSPGSAASQNSWSVVKVKPMLFRRTVTALHTIHTAKASSSAGMEIHRLRVAMRLPVSAQKAASSGRQSWITGPALGGGTNLFKAVMMVSSSGSGRRRHGALRALAHQRGFADFAEVHPDQGDPDHAVQQHEA